MVSLINISKLTGTDFIFILEPPHKIQHIIENLKMFSINIQCIEQISSTAFQKIARHINVLTLKTIKTAFEIFYHFF